MKKFLIRIILVTFIPAILLAGVYVITDPFKTLRPFSFHYFDETNRDFISSELFLKNDPIYHYNSFIFGSSACCGFNSYQWKHYLPDGARQFLFQAWGETLTGIEQKINYLDKNGNSIDNAIVMFNIPGTFDENQLPKAVLSIKHYKFSGQSKMAFQACLFGGFVQKPSKWFSSIIQCFNPDMKTFPADTISNDWKADNRNADIGIQPAKDSLHSCSAITKAVFLKEIESKTDLDLKVSEPLVTSAFLVQLNHIKAVFDKHHTDYRIIIAPAYCYNHPKINAEDLRILQDIFGEGNVFDYSGKNEITVDYNNFSDPNHFGLSVGWQIIEDIYNSK